MTLWVVRGGRQGEQEQDIMQNNVAAIGWQELPDLSAISSRANLEEVYFKAKPDAKKMEAANEVSQLWWFTKEIQKGDLVVVPLKTRSSVLIGEVIGDYQYSQITPKVKHFRQVKWIKTAPKGALRDLAERFNINRTVFQVKDEIAESRIRSIISGTESYAQLVLTDIQRAHIKNYATPFRNFLGTEKAKEIMGIRNAKIAHYKVLLSPDNIAKMTREEIVNLKANLWSTNMWSKKDYAINQFLTNNPDLDAFKAELKHLLWGEGPIRDRYDRFRHNVYGLGSSGITELLAFVHPDKFALRTGRSRKAFAILGIDELLPSKNEITGEEYELYNRMLILIKDELNSSGLNLEAVMELHLFEYYLSSLNEEEIKKTPRQIGKTTEVIETPMVDVQWIANETFLTLDHVKDIEKLLKRKLQVIFFGPPGTGKSYLAEKFALLLTNGRKDNVEKIQFHPSYSYEDFMEGIRPDTNNGNIAYHVHSGVFKKLCERAEKSNDTFVIIIDEINRGNIPRIFGEVIYCLEYRGEGVHLPYSQNSFQIPSNLVIIGTMNSADRSIAFLDYALRRRFAFVEFMPNNSIISKWFSVKYPDMDLDPLIELFEDINEKIVEWKGPEFQVGHSYFMPKQMTVMDFEAIWRYDIRPLLGEYFLNDKEKLEKFDELYTGFKEKMSQNEVQ